MTRLKKTGPSRRRLRAQTLHPWINTLAATAALVFSWLTYSALPPDEPDTEVSLPRVIKVRWHESFTSVFIQPTVSTRFDTKNVEMINDVELSLRSDNTFGSPAMTPRFNWEDTVQWIFREDRNAVWWEFLSDPGPFTVTQEEIHQPFIRFTAEEWRLAPGRYTGNLTVYRASHREPLRKPFCLVLSHDAITDLVRNKDNNFPDEFRSDIPEAAKDGCYHQYE
ncbi:MULTISPECIES: hypothetical protein [Streptomyces]|uniref:hypothetical protein n=1 Tax=Streptomyces TaxID=1883 RepID=UPI000F54FF2A|nr:MULTISPECIES: hypothetical protein [Streptomyces]RPK53344.1 hypothetical protein EES37_01740 [Streptomyces sp. ADI91-18]WSR98655.1 hypothetical protein OG224_11600 [Streptomyces goshikiensis]GHD69726.1 hypothetical protein GCM10010336_36390 [Streptomyces goshikiensis]